MGSVSRNIIVVAATAIFLAAATAAALTLGASSVSLPELAAWLVGGDVSDMARNILENVRVPRVLAALLAGAALATSGALIQACLDNPLASPNVIGVNSGAGLAVLLAASLAPRGAVAHAAGGLRRGAGDGAHHLCAVAGHGLSRLTVVLAGIAITTVFGAGMNTILIVDPDAYVGSSTFLVGGLSGVLMRDLAWPAAYIAVGLVAALAGAAKLNISSLGDEAAHSLGVNVRAVASGDARRGRGARRCGRELRGAYRVRGACGAAPHALLRRPRQPLGGAGIGLGRRLAFVVGCDLLARVLFAPYELPVGILLAFIGGPFFIYLILKNKGGGLD